MGRRVDDTDVSPTERTVPNDPEKTLVAPRFDEKSIQGARPAVPLTWRGKARSSSLTIIVACVAAGLVGGLVGGVALRLFQRNDPRAETPNTRQQAGDGAAGNDSAAQSAPAATAPNAREGNAAQATQGDEHEQATQPTQEQTNRDAAARAPTNAGGVPEAAHTAAAAGAAQASVKAGGDESAVADAGESKSGAGAGDELRSALVEWVAATNARDIGRQMDFYAPTVNAYYLSRNASREAVRAEKTRVFSRADAVDVQAGPPDISVSGDGQTAVMRFRKRYRIQGGAGQRSGEVLQELRWRRMPGGWKIVGERDLRVIQ
ncbi:MAG TPA: nuclear transport factor 2 family protein [Pyrinomonadaceae bacterium]|jgi:ketosteroid isomerase-like protein|nr:nuclear transport factor 2 family protein [Pyrinomonadaceae bacterium]